MTSSFGITHKVHFNLKFCVQIFYIAFIGSSYFIKSPRGAHHKDDAYLELPSKMGESKKKKKWVNETYT